jgi:hypothetical protein
MNKVCPCHLWISHGSVTRATMHEDAWWVESRDRHLMTKKHSSHAHLWKISLCTRNWDTPSKGEGTCTARHYCYLDGREQEAFFLGAAHHRYKPWTSTQTSKYDYTPSPNVTKLLNMHMQLSRDSEIILPNPNLILVTISCFMLLACNFYRSYPMQREMHARLCTLAKTQGAFFLFLSLLYSAIVILSLFFYIMILPLLFTSQRDFVRSRCDFANRGEIVLVCK